LRLLALVGFASSCGSEPRRHVDLEIIDECHGLSDRVLCSADTALTCSNGNVSRRVACAQTQQTCAPGLGCKACIPNAISCDGSQRYACNADGSARTQIETCAADLQCSPSGCKDLCAEAAKDRSYLGCDYWPVFTSNSLLPPEFYPAVSIGNGNLIAAHVTITQAGAPVAEADIPAQSASTINLTASDALKNPRGSLLVRDGAYHLVSNVPVTVHQFNPLLFELPFDCAAEPSQADSSDGKCNSYTNDASLLFPSTALSPDSEGGATNVEFYALSRGPFETAERGEPFGGVPGFVAIVAVGATPVHVRIESSAQTMASPPGDPNFLAALQPGQALEQDLRPGDVLQLLGGLSECTDPSATVAQFSAKFSFCDPGAAFDLTGTRIIANGAVQVISGHDCSNVPFDRVACDHLEESQPPLATWSNNAVLSVPSSSAGAQYVARVLSGTDDNQITFDPPLHEPVTLARGQWLELSAHDALYVHGSNRLLVGQYLVGANGGPIGDPSLTVAVPSDQWRQSYNFISPESYEQNVVDIIATDGDVITLDGTIVTGFNAVGSTRYRVVTAPLNLAGAHEIHGSSASGFAIAVYGLGSYTSYMLPGGRDLRPIAIGF
jgi:hypothetical protein